MYTIEVNSYDQWRNHARELLRRAIPADQIHWQTTTMSASLFEDASSYLQLAIQQPKPSITAAFFELADSVACFRDEQRWPLLYSIAWRITYENRQLLEHRIDPQIAQAYSMAKSVHRDQHKMKAFVRFKQIHSENPQAVPNSILQPSEDYYLAWFQPEHLIVRSIAPFFRKRFSNMNWSIVTPDLSVHWNQKSLSFTDGSHQAPKTEDQLESLWLEYYANIFNPARLKLKAMQKEMPKKYWINLPEAPLIAPLTRNAGKRVDEMISDSRELTKLPIKR